MPVINLGQWHSFPTPHALDFAGAEIELLKEADTLLALEVLDLAGTLRSAGVQDGRRHTVIGVSLDELLQRSLTTDYQGLPAVDVPILSGSRSALPLLLEECRRLLDSSARGRVEARRKALESRQAELRAGQQSYVAERWNHPQITEARLVGEVWQGDSEGGFRLHGGTGEPDSAWGLPPSGARENRRGRRWRRCGSGSRCRPRGRAGTQGERQIAGGYPGRR